MAGGHPTTLRDGSDVGRLCPHRLLADTAFALAPDRDQTAHFLEPGAAISVAADNKRRVPPRGMPA